MPRRVLIEPRSRLAVHPQTVERRHHGLVPAWLRSSDCKPERQSERQSDNAHPECKPEYQPDCKPERELFAGMASDRRWMR